MRKYFQISFFFIIFAILVIFRQVKGSESAPVVGNNNQTQNPTSTPTITPTSAPITDQTSISPQFTSTPTPKPQGQYKDGNYTGSVEDAFYGNIRVKAVISNGKITDVIFLQYPNDNSNSVFINTQAMPLLKQEAIQAQSANVDIISGASASSQAFQASLANALAQAKS